MYVCGDGRVRRHEMCHVFGLVGAGGVGGVLGWLWGGCGWVWGVLGFGGWFGGGGGFWSSKQREALCRTSTTAKPSLCEFVTQQCAITAAFARLLHAVRLFIGGNP